MFLCLSETGLIIISPERGGGGASGGNIGGATSKLVAGLS